MQDWTDGGTPPGTIAVLIHDKYQCERVVNGLGERKVQARAVDRERPPTDRVLVMTMHRAKGMEFSKVVLTGSALDPPPSEPAWNSSTIPSDSTPNFATGHCCLSQALERDEVLQRA